MNRPRTILDVTAVMAKRAPDWVVTRVLGMRRRVAQVHSLLTPPSVRVLEQSLGLVDTKVLGVLAELGIPEALREGATDVATLARRVEAHPDSLERVLRYAAMRGYVELMGDGRYRGNASSDALCEDHPESVRAFVRFFASKEHGEWWSELGRAVRTGVPGARNASGAEVFELLERDPDLHATYHRAMENISAHSRRYVADRYPFGGVQRVCDVGGGTGRNLAALLQAHPHLRGVLFELPSVLVDAGPVLVETSVADRVDLVAGSVFDGVPAGCDVYTLQAILHLFGDATCVSLLRTLRASIPDHARILIIETEVSTDPLGEIGRMLDLEMLVATDQGRERTEVEFEALFGAAGFVRTKTFRLPTGIWLIEAAKA